MSAESLNAAPSRPQRPLRDRVLWLLLGHGGWVGLADVAAQGRTDEAAVLVALRELEANRLLECREMAGAELWRVAGPDLGREAGREMVRERLTLKVLGRNEPGLHRMGVCRVVNQAPGHLGVLLAELVMPMEPDAAALQAVVDRFVAYGQKELEAVDV